MKHNSGKKRIGFNYEYESSTLTVYYVVQHRFPSGHRSSSKRRERSGVWMVTPVYRSCICRCHRPARKIRGVECHLVARLVGECRVPNMRFPHPFLSSWQDQNFDKNLKPSQTVARAVHRQMEAAPLYLITLGRGLRFR